MTCCSSIRPAAWFRCPPVRTPGRGRTAGHQRVRAAFGQLLRCARRVVVMLSSLGMSLFFITGWMLYLDRRRSQRAPRGLRARCRPRPPMAVVRRGWWCMPARADWANNWRGVRPRSGHAVAGLIARCRPPPGAARAEHVRRRRATGCHAPHATAACRACSSAWLADLATAARPLFERIDVDAASVPALRQWQQQLGTLTGIVTDDSVLPAATQMHGAARPRPPQPGQRRRSHLAYPSCRTGRRSGRRVTSCTSHPATTRGMPVPC